MTVHFLRLLSALVLCGAFAAQAHATDFSQPRAGLYTGGQPTAEALRTLSQQGVRTVIDLRAASEDRGFDETAETEKLGMRYIHLPIANADDLTPANTAALGKALQESGDRVLLHCASGNRVGALLALMAARQEQATPEQALDLGRRAGLKSLEPQVVQKLQDLTTP